MKPRDNGMTSSDPIYHQKSDLIIMKKCLATLLALKNTSDFIKGCQMC